MEIEADGRWRSRALFVAVGLLALVSILFPTYAEIVDFWQTYSAYNHCILIIPISLYLIYENNSRLLTVEPAISWFGALFFSGNCLLWIAGGFLSIAFFQHFAAVGLIIGLTWILIGDSATRAIAFPLLYLYFGVPEGEVLVPYLRDLTAEVVVKLLRVTGIPVFLEGRYLTIPSGQFHVAKACSGINYLIATLAVGTVFAYTRYASNWRRLAFMLLAISIPLLANGMRAYGIVMIAHLSNYKYAIGIDHYIYGWVFFGVVIFILFMAGNLFSDKNFLAPKPKISRWTYSDRVSYTAPVLMIFLTILVLLATDGVHTRATETPLISDKYTLSSHPNWTLTDKQHLELFGSFEGEPIVLRGQYDHQKSDKSVGLQMVLYLNPDEHGELENRANQIFDEEQWQRIEGPEILESDLASLPVVQEFALRRYGQKHLVWAWYDVNGAILISPSDAKWTLIKDRMTGEYRGGAQISIISAIDHDVPSTRASLREFFVELDVAMPSLRTTKE